MRHALGDIGYRPGFQLQQNDGGQGQMPADRAIIILFGRPPRGRGWQPLRKVGMKMNVRTLTGRVVVVRVADAPDFAKRIVLSMCVRMRPPSDQRLHNKRSSETDREEAMKIHVRGNLSACFYRALANHATSVPRRL